MLDNITYFLFEIFEAGLLIILLLIPLKFFKLNFRYIYATIMLSIFTSFLLFFTSLATNHILLVFIFLILTFLLFFISFILITNNEKKTRSYLLPCSIGSIFVLTTHEMYEISIMYQNISFNQTNILILFSMCLILLFSSFIVINNIFYFLKNKYLILSIYFSLSIVNYKVFLEIVEYSKIDHIELFVSSSDLILFENSLYMLYFFIYLTFAIINHKNLDKYNNEEN